MQQILPFEEWIPPTRTFVAALQSATSTFRHIRSQKHWLLKTHAQAYLGIPGLPNLISEQSGAYRTLKGDGSVGCVLAVGEMPDLRNKENSSPTSLNSARPVVAIAAGDAGHLLHVMCIQRENWSWNKHVLSVGAPELRVQNFWCLDNNPILHIQFVSKHKEDGIIRWFIVQKANSTTILELELTAKPAIVDTAVAPDRAPTVDQITINPIVTITKDATGGQDHCDFSINLGSDQDRPQLAIMDSSGSYSVWSIKRKKSKPAKPVLRKKAVWDLPIHVPIEAASLRQMHRVAWTSLSSSTDDRERDSEGSDLHSRALQSPYVTGVGAVHSGCDGLLLSNNTHVQVRDVDGNRSLSSLDFSMQYGQNTLLDTQPFSGSPSHVFVLTTEKVYLLDVSVVEDQEAEPPRILVSCNHSRKHHQQSLKMSIFNLQSSHDQACNLVVVHSTQSFRISLFWFTISQREGGARLHHQALQLPGLKTSDAKGSQGIESVAVLPLQLSPEAEEHDPGHAHPDTKIQFYQLFRLATDLSLNTLTFAIVHGVSQGVTRPIKMGTAGSKDATRTKVHRKKRMTVSEQAFVVPDETPRTTTQLRVVSAARLFKSPRVAQLRYYLLRLIQEINCSMLEEVAGEADGARSPEPFMAVQEILRNREQDDIVSLKPLLEYSNLWQSLNLVESEDWWSLSLKNLKDSREVQLFRCGTYGCGLSVVDVFEKISINWSAQLPEEALETTQWEYMEMALKRMAVEVCLSEQGVYMVPQLHLDLASKALPHEDDQVYQHDAWHGPLSSHPGPSLALPPPSGTSSHSRATSEAVDSARNDEEDGEEEQEDPAVARLRIYLPSVKYTPPQKQKNGTPRVLSLWPEQRGVDPSVYRYKSRRAAEAEAAKRKRKQAERRQRKEERKAQLRIAMEGAGMSSSQPVPPTMRWSAFSQQIGSSQTQSQGFGSGFGFSSQLQSPSQRPGSGLGSQSQGFSQGFGHSQTMSQAPSVRSAKTKSKQRVFK